MMSRLLIILLMAGTLSGCVEVFNDAVERDTFRLQFQGRNQAWIIPDAIHKDRFRVQDPKTGQYTHTIKPDVLYPDRYIIEKGAW